MSEKSGIGRLGQVVLWIGGIALGIYVLIVGIIPTVSNIVGWVGSSDGAATLIWLGIWVVCGLISYAIAGLFTDSVIARVIIAVLGAVALGILLIWLLFSVVFSGSERRS